MGEENDAFHIYWVDTAYRGHEGETALTTILSQHITSVERQNIYHDEFRTKLYMSDVLQVRVMEWTEEKRAEFLVTEDNRLRKSGDIKYHYTKSYRNSITNSEDKIEHQLSVGNPMTFPDNHIFGILRYKFEHTDGIASPKDCDSSDNKMNAATARMNNESGSRLFPMALSAALTVKSEQNHGISLMPCGVS